MLLPRPRSDRHHDRFPLDTDVLDHRPLDPERRRNGLSAQLANGVLAALDGLRTDGVRAVVLRAAAGM